ncbi:MAG: ABC transporter permease subunit [Alphaproteobacteria bacterium]|nr:ABC transporter permease subunit [Alphaproteobacteria bacterium]
MAGAPRTPFSRPGLVALLPFLWLVLFVLVPLAIVFKISLAESVLARPPYTPLFEWSGEGWPQLRASFANYTLLIEDDVYRRSLWGSLRIAALGTLAALAIGLPLAYAMSRAPRRMQGTLLLAVMLPFWTAFLIRIYAWMVLLRNEGLVNLALRALGITDVPLAMLGTEGAVVLGIAYAYLPFMVLPIYASLERQDPAVLEAAADLGAPPAAAFWSVTVPLARPGILAGCLLVFLPALGEVVIPDLLGGSGTLMLGRTIWTEFFQNRDWPMAGALTILLLVVLGGPLLWLQRQQARLLAQAER